MKPIRNWAPPLLGFVILATLAAVVVKLIMADLVKHPPPAPIEDGRFSYNIDKKDPGDALTEWAIQSKVVTMYFDWSEKDKLRGPVHPIHGRYTRSDAITQMLDGTGWRPTITIGSNGSELWGMELIPEEQK